MIGFSCKNVGFMRPSSAFLICNMVDAKCHWPCFDLSVVKVKIGLNDERQKIKLM